MAKVFLLPMASLLIDTFPMFIAGLLMDSLGRAPADFIWFPFLFSRISSSCSSFEVFCKTNFSGIYLYSLSMYMYVLFCTNKKSHIHEYWIGPYHVELLPVMDTYENRDSSNASLLLRTCIQFGSFRTEKIRMHPFFMVICSFFGSLMPPFLLVLSTDVCHVICDLLYCRI